MSKITGLGRLAASAALAAAIALPALAQQAPALAPGATDKLPTGSLEKYHDALRASELVGASVFDDQGNSIGKVNDMLVGPDGNTKGVVLSVGGFLGIASRYVEVSFDQLKVQPSRSTTISAATPDPGLSGSAAPAAGAGGTAGPGTSTGLGTSAGLGTAAGLGTPPGTAATGVTPGAAVPAAPTPAAAVPSKQYFSLVMPGATKDSLMKLPEFKYES